MRRYDDALCLNCTLSACDDEAPQCFYKIWREAPAKEERLRQQKREHNRRAREARRSEIPELRLIFSRMLTDYGTYGKHRDVMEAVRKTK